MKKSYLFLACLLASCGSMVEYKNPVINADVPDPSVIRVGDTYYAAGTSGNAPQAYPLFTSKDLLNWTPAGHVFDSYPSWVKGDFWAPELYVHNGKTYCYYTARKKSDGISCIGVAVADSPTGRFIDHGIIVDWGKEAIDAFVYNDDGQLWLVFKAYGLNPERPIELLAVRLTEDGLHTMGEPVSLLQDMENIGMEGQSVVKHDGYYYIFYAARDCCTDHSDYEVRVARAKKFTGPYEKYSGNPILKGMGMVKQSEPAIQSLGHGTPVQSKNGHWYYLCHSYFSGKFKEGRKPVLYEFTFRDGWPEFLVGKVATVEAGMHEAK